MSSSSATYPLVRTRFGSADDEEKLEDHEEFDPQLHDPSTFTGPIDNGAPADDVHAAALAILPKGDNDFVHAVLGVEGYHEADPGHKKRQEHVHTFIEDNSNDSSSLFIPEHDPLSDPPRSFTLPSHLIAAPRSLSSISDRQSAAPPKLSVFAKVRDMQRRAKERKKVTNNHAASPRLDNLNAEVYQEAVTASLRPSAPVEIDEDEMAHRQALAEYQRQKRHYEDIKAQNNGRLPFRQDVEWMRVKGAEDARLMKRQRDLAMTYEGDEQDLFPPITYQANEQDEAYENELYNDGESRKRRRGDQPRKFGKQMSMQDAELQAMQVALEVDQDVCRKRKKGVVGDDTVQDGRPPPSKKANKSKTARPSRAKAAGKSTARTSRKTAKEKRELERATKQATSLFNANVFEQQAGMAGADQPTFRTRKKADALKELIASVPTQERNNVRNDMNTLLQASKEFDGQAACKLASHGNWMVRGMKTTLKGYQVLGSAFMRRRENDTQEPRGGLMADQMGLGKTLMMLANIVNSRDGMIRRKENGPKTTLLVANPALLSQWASEIEQHTDCDMKVMRYGIGNRPESTDALYILGHHDIILTTYSEVMKSYPKNEPPIECQTAEQKIAWWKETYANHRGVLHQIFFKRIVLDEAQAIKNYKGRISIACRALMADHKWALSGTPVLNGLDELYPYFKFLNVPHTGSFKIFKHNYCGAVGGENAERLLVRLSQFMIRRTHADRMFNAPILKLPQANQSTHWCDFNSVERSIYGIVHQRFAKNINMLARQGTLERSYSNVLVMLLRLRQLTAHVLMLQFVMRDLLEREDIERIKEVVKNQADNPHISQGRTILAIRKQLEEHEKQEKRKTAKKAARRLATEAAAVAAGREYEEPEDEDEEDVEPIEILHDGEADEEDTGTFRSAERNKSGKGFGKSYDFKPFVNSLATGEAWENKKEKAQCGQCGKRPLKPWLTACGHLICQVPCYEDVMIAAAEAGHSHGTCKACGDAFHACRPMEEDAEDVPGSSRMTRGRNAQKKKQPRLDPDIEDNWLSLGGDEVLPSAKTIATKAQILNWITDNPTVKIIIYTQFLAMIRILAKVCQQEGWGAEQYHGQMSLGARDKAIKQFANDPRARILIASLRCGGLGLNLTMASKVIIIDPWWNQASEQQAFCRVFRIGQLDETFMSRLCVKNTVDERLIEMQKEKQREIDEVMEDRGKKTENLSTAHLMRLFGNIQEDHDGKPFIMVDNPDAAGGFFADRDHEGYADEF